MPLPLVGMEGKCPTAVWPGRDERVTTAWMPAEPRQAGHSGEVRAKESPPGRQPPGLQPLPSLTPGARAEGSAASAVGLTCLLLNGRNMSGRASTLQPS